MTHPLWNATPAELDAYAELDELAAQWKALADWERLERRREEYRQCGAPRTVTVGPRAAVDEPEPSTQRSAREGDPPEEPFPLVQRTRPKRPSWFDFAFSLKAPRRSSGHANDDPAQLPRPRFRD